uniref:Protein CyaY n=1 Tax=Lygus hesperus TaxID=30085 RepID=A0A0A9YB97_LYGHE
MEESHNKEVSFMKKKTKKRNFDLKLPEYIRIDWRRPKCHCKEACHCSNFTCRMTYTSPDAPVDRAIDTKVEEGIDWTKVLNIDLLNVTWREARISDFDAIHQLVDDNSRNLFEIDETGSKILYLIEHSFYFLVAINFQGVIVGAISVNDAPPLCYIAPAEWDNWLQKKFELYKFRYHNTLWIHFLGYTKRYKNVIFHRLLVPIFMRCSLVTKLAIYVPPKVKVRKKWICFFELVGTSVKPGPQESHMGVDSDSDEYPTNIYCVSRNRFLEPLALRKAEKEDKEVMQKTLEKDHKKLSKRFGNNYLNKIITDPRYTTFIGSTVDSQHQPAIFFMKNEFDVEYIREKFEIYAFNNFKSNKATDYLMQPEKRYISAVSQEMVEVSDVYNGEEVRRFHEQDDKDDAEEKEEKDDEEGEPTVIEGLTWTNFLMTGTQDSDEEEGRGMDRIICTDNPIDKITYKNLCMAMSSTNVVKDFKATLAARKTQATVNLSFEVEGNFNAITLEYINMGAEPITSVKALFQKILDSFPSYEYIIMKIPRIVTPPPDCITDMMRVFPLGHKNWLYFDEDLYLFHRWFASGIAESRKAEKSDFQTLLNVLCMENSSEEIQQELFTSLFGED